MAAETVAATRFSAVPAIPNVVALSMFLMLVVGSVAGAVIAVCIFAATAVSVPMLMSERVDFLLALGDLAFAFCFAGED